MGFYAVLDYTARYAALLAAACQRSEGNIYRSLSPNVSSSPFHTIYIQTSRRVPLRNAMHRDAMLSSVDGKRYVRPSPCPQLRTLLLLSTREVAIVTGPCGVSNQRGQHTDGFARPGHRILQA
jgi:hypothetical protein